MRDAIDEDAEHGITARWHDESHWNRYLIDNPPDVVLPGDWMCSDENQQPNQRLIALTKDHEAMRCLKSA